MRPCGCAGPRGRTRGVRALIAFVLWTAARWVKRALRSAAVRTPPGRGTDGRDVSFALRTSVHNLNRMPPCPSADSQRPLCNCCHRPGAPWHPRRRGWRSHARPRGPFLLRIGSRRTRPIAAVGLWVEPLVGTLLFGQINVLLLALVVGAAADPRRAARARVLAGRGDRGRRRRAGYRAAVAKYQSGCGCWIERKRVGPGCLRERADPGCGLARGARQASPGYRGLHGGVRHGTVQFP